MAKKSFNTQDTVNKFFTAGNQEIQEIQEKPDVYPTAESHKRPGRPKKEKKLRAYRFSVLLDEDLDKFIHEIVWIRRTNMTQYINDIVRADKEKYVKECLEKGVNPYEGWEEENKPNQ